MAEEPKTLPPIEKLVAELPFASRGAHAPIIFFDDVETFGHYNGVVHFTLKVALPEKDGTPQVTAAYLRMNVLAFRQLQNAVNGVDLMLKREGQ